MIFHFNPQLQCSLQKFVALWLLLGTTGYMSPCCSGMCLIWSNCNAFSACLSRTVRNPAGFYLSVCLSLSAGILV